MNATINSQKETSMTMTVQIMRADVPNSNGRAYPMSALEHCVEIGKGRTIFGILGAPTSSGQLDMNQISHVVQDLRIEDGYLVGDVQVLQTSQGDILQQLLGEVQIDFRATGVGTLGADGVVSDFKLVSIDALYDGADL